MRPTAQGIVMAIHHGLGRAMGTIIGGAFVHSYADIDRSIKQLGDCLSDVSGWMINNKVRLNANKTDFIIIGTEYTFRGYGIATIIILAAYLALNYFYIRKYLPQDGPADPSALEETHLAPHGVPISMSRSRSNVDMDDAVPSQQQYGAAGSGSTVGNFLHPGDKTSQGNEPGGYQNPYHIGYDYNEEELAKIDMSHFDKFSRKIGSQQQPQQQQPQQQPPQPKQQQQPQQQQQYYQQQQQHHHHQQQQQQPQQRYQQQQPGGYRGGREAVVVGNAPRPTTELRMQQPRNTDASDHDADWY
ncbi:hypothetical protein LSH36_141g02031 [Paralvinella palmiformis]|uniref:Uncharacterized protein n=1 Tax=Paralvinella palmiformis TaxID=53620 RepID=A0AAD9JV63_9ANNE|nr:hypothetical protein LSH36_141g02031 [Paralvinella palmiformis]